VRVDIGKSHEIDLIVPILIHVEGDKTGITLTGESPNKHKLSQFFAKIHNIQPLNLKSQGFILTPACYFKSS